MEDESQKPNAFLAQVEELEGGGANAPGFLVPYGFGIGVGVV